MAPLGRHAVVRRAKVGPAPERATMRGRNRAQLSSPSPATTPSRRRRSSSGWRACRVPRWRPYGITSKLLVGAGPFSAGPSSCSGSLPGSAADRRKAGPPAPDIGRGGGEWAAGQVVAHPGAGSPEALAAVEARPARAEDTDRLVDLWLEAVAELRAMRGGRVLLALMERPCPPAGAPGLVAGSFASQLGDPSQLVVVGARDGHVAGYGTCAAVRPPGEDPIGSIGELYVSPSERHQGVGHAMAATLVQWCQARGCTGVDALALPGSRATKSFFEEEGFRARLLVMHRSLVTGRPAADDGRRA